jgi:lysophospholipase L1-like esterase
VDAARTRQPRSLGKRLAFASVPLLVLLLALELLVRGLGLDQTCPNSYNEAGVWTCDPILNFKLKPDLIAGGQPLNRAGFRSREFTDKAPGMFRVLSLGDSCTFGIIATETQPFAYIQEPYPQQLERLVAERIGAGQLEVLNAGIPGYNSFQGLMLLRSKLRGLEPDLITVRYGWNDHFMSAEAAGAYGYREPDNAIVLGLQDLMLRTSLYGFFRRLHFEWLALHETAKPPAGAALPTEWLPNIPLDVYKHNLRRIVAMGHAQGAEVWLLTSPNAFVIDSNRGQEDRFPESARLLLVFNALPSFERLVEIHDSYNEATREVGAELRAPVIDMDAMYRAHASEPLFLQTDVPHPSPQGHALEAERLYSRLVAEGFVQPRSSKLRP